MSLPACHCRHVELGVSANSGVEMNDVKPTNGEEATRRGPLAPVDGFLKSPFAGIAPWALLSILSAPGRFEVAAGAALGFSVLLLLAGLARGLQGPLLGGFGCPGFATLAT